MMATAPFPGMDPFLENPAEWGGVYTRLMNSISDQLAALVQPNFLVKIEQHVYLMTPMKRAHNRLCLMFTWSKPCR